MPQEIISKTSGETETNPIKQHTQNFFFGQPHSQTFKVIIVVLFQLILILAVFAIGINVGVHKSRYTYMWAKNYANNFPAPSGYMAIQPPPNPEAFFNAHGIDGSILSINKNTITIKDDTGQEKTIIAATNTPIRYNFSSLGVSDLKPGQEIVVLGDPDDQGQFNAKLIRILDESSNNK